LPQSASEIEQMQQALQLMHLKLTTVMTDRTGFTGRQISRALRSGEQDPVTLARLRDPRCPSSEAEIAKALTGNYPPAPRFALRQAVEGFDCYPQPLAVCAAEIERLYALFGPPLALVAQPLPAAHRRHRPHHPDSALRTDLSQLAGVALTAGDGMDLLLAQAMLAEVGSDISQWQTAKHFAAGLRLAPHPKSSAGKRMSRHTPSTHHRASTAWRLAAQAVSRTQSPVGACYRRLTAKQGAPVASSAPAQKLARLVDQLRNHRTPYAAPASAA
jgi:transposase